jgi:hypothetical protein
MENPILDEPEKPASDRIWAILGWIAIALMTIGLIMRLMHWPGAMLAIAASGVVMLVRFMGLRPAGGNTITSWLYLAGHFTLGLVFATQYAVIYFQFDLSFSPMWLFFIPALLYLAGMLAAEKKTEEPN